MTESIEFLGHNLIIDESVYYFINDRYNVNIKFIREEYEHLFLVCSKCNTYLQIDYHSKITSMERIGDYNLTCDEQIIKNILE